MSEFEISFLLLCHFIVCSAGLASETAAFDRCSQWIFLKKDTTIFRQRFVFSSLLCFATTFGEFKVKSLTKGTFGLVIHQQMVGVKQCRSQKLFWHFSDSLVWIAMMMISKALWKTADAVFQPHWTLSFTFLPITHIKTLQMDWTRFVIFENWNTWQQFDKSVWD